MHGHTHFPRTVLRDNLQWYFYPIFLPPALLAILRSKHVQVQMEETRGHCDLPRPARQRAGTAGRSDGEFQWVYCIGSQVKQMAMTIKLAKIEFLLSKMSFFFQG